MSSPAAPMAAAEEKQVAGLATRRSSRHDLRHDPEHDPGIDGGLAREPNVATQGDTVGPPIATPPHPLLGKAESKETVTRRFPEGKPASVRAPGLPLWDDGRAPEPGFRQGSPGGGGPRRGRDGGVAREPNVATQGDTVGPPIATPPHPLLGQAESKETVTRRFPEGKPASVRAPDLPLWDDGRAPEPGFRHGRAGVGGPSSGRPDGCLTAGGLGSIEAVGTATLDRPGAGMVELDHPPFGGCTSVARPHLDRSPRPPQEGRNVRDRKSTRLNSRH